jgi:2-dehydro-3-deoxygalactonokinase
MKRRLLAVDWGTSSLRGALLGDGGQVLEELQRPMGLLQVSPGGWQAAFDEAFGPWLSAWPQWRALMCGMVGSRQGWVEAPYLDCPADVRGLASKLQVLREGRHAIVPGLRCEADGVPDVMRGEETQVAGALSSLQPGEATLVLPGTHSKWVRLRGERVESFATHMTGECFALWRRHSLLSRSLPEKDAWRPEAFDAGVRRAQQPGGLLHHLFGVRSLSLFERLPEEDRGSYLSGLVIGEELRAQQIAPGLKVAIVGSDALCERYARALQQLGAQPRALGDDVTWRGLWAVAQAAGWTEGETE